MDLTPDFLPVHLCQHCDKFILDSSAGGFFNWKRTTREWAVFNPELTAEGLEKLQGLGCLLSEVFCRSL